jgi:hypothetical protein
MKGVAQEVPHRAAGLAVLLVMATVLYPASSNAADVNAGFSLGVAYTDNIDRLDSGGRNETIAQTGMTLSILEASRRINADVRSSLNYYDYIDNTFDSDLVGAVDALIDLSVVEGRIHWFVQENYGRTLFDPFQPDRPENWENLNFLTTGPTIVLYQGVRNDSGIDLRYSWVHYETRPFDNETANARFWVGREIRRDHRLSINLDVAETEYDNGGLTPDYERRSAFLRYEIDRGRNLLEIDAGFTEQEILSQTDDGVMFNASWTHQISAFSQFSLNLTRQFADQANVFRFQQDTGRDIDSIGDLTENGSPFLLNGIDVGYSLTGERTIFSISAGASDQEFDTQDQLDREDVRLDLFLQRNLTRSLFASIDLRFHRRELPNVSREDETRSGSLSVGYRFSDALDLAIRYTNTSQDSSSITNKYEENRGDLTLTYIPAWGR